MFDQKKLSLFCNTLTILRLNKTRECLQYNQQSPSFLKSMVLGEMRACLKEKKKNKDNLWVLMFTLYHTLCNRNSGYWSALPDSISSHPMRVEIADWDKLKVPSSSCLKLLFQGIAFSLLVSAVPLSLIGCNCKMDGGTAKRKKEMAALVWCGIVCDVCLKDLCPD